MGEEREAIAPLSVFRFAFARSTVAKTKTMDHAYSQVEAVDPK